MRVRIYNDLVRDLADWSNAMNEVFVHAFAPYDYAASGGSNGQANGNGAKPAVTPLPLDVWATPEAFFVSAYVPGVNPEDVEITFEGKELTIRGTLPSNPDDVNYIKRELYHGSFERRLSFNVPVNVEGIEAHFNNGLLTLTVPKAEAVRPKQIKVQVR